MRYQTELVAGGFTLLESPRWRPEGLYVSDFFSESIMLFADPDHSAGYRTIAHLEGRPSGLGFIDDRLYAVSMLGRSVNRVADDHIASALDLSGLLTSEANDMYIAPRGRIYVGTFGTRGFNDSTLAEGVIVSSKLGDPPALAASGLVFPNGIVASPDGTTLYVAETYAARVSQFSIAPDGSLSNRRVFVDFSSGQPLPRTTSEGDRTLAVLPDGLAVDELGGVWMADAKGSSVRRFTPDGEETDQVDTSPLSPYAVALGGPDGRSLYACCAPANGTFDPSTEHRSVLLRTRVVTGRLR